MFKVETSAHRSGERANGPNFPLPGWEGIKGRGITSGYFKNIHPHPDPPPSRGRKKRMAFVKIFSISRSLKLKAMGGRNWLRFNRLLPKAQVISGLKAGRIAADAIIYYIVRTLERQSAPANHDINQG
jgi:hypothetical protein